MTNATQASPVGKFVWYDWMGDDVQAAADFYSRVVGWNAKDSGMPGTAYTILSAGDHMVAGMMKIPADAKAMGARASWNGYVWVEDVDAAAAEVAAAGGSVQRPGTDIPGVGRFAVVTDPFGAYFLLFRDSGGAPPPPPPPGTPGLVGWHELHSDDAGKALAFYSGLYGWKHESDFDMGAMGAYRIFSTGHGESGGMMNRMKETPMSFWLYYFNVEAIDAGVERIKENGGRIANGPHEVPGGLWIVQGLDPQGALFALVAPKR